MAITYERVNWEDAPSTATPWDAEHLNIMDEGIEQVTEHSSDLEETVDYLDDRQEVLERRMDLIASIPDSAIDQRTIAELKDVRIGYDGSSFSTAGNAVRGQVRDLMQQLNALVAQAQAISDRIDSIIAVPPEETEGNQELIDIRTGYDGTQYLTAGTAVREQFNAVIDKVEHTDNSIELTMAEYEALSEEEKNNGSIYFITDAGGQRDAITVRYDNEDSSLEATNLQDAVDEVVSLRGTSTDFGFVKLSDNYSALETEGDAANSKGASQNAVYNVYKALNDRVVSGNGFSALQNINGDVRRRLQISGTSDSLVLYKKEGEGSWVDVTPTVNLVKKGATLSGYLYGITGYVTTAMTSLAIDIPLQLDKGVTSITFSRFIFALRAGNNSYAGGQDFDGLSYIHDVKVNTNQGIVHVILNKADGWGTTNNIPVAGVLLVTATVS